MKIIEDPKIFRPLVEEAIKRYGFAPEHNLAWWLAYVDKTQKPVVAYWEETGEIELAHKSDKDWYTFSEPLVKAENRGQHVAELVEFVLKNYPDVEKVVTEAQEDTRQQIIESLPEHLMVIDHTEDGENNYILTWPIMNMEKFDPALPGGHFKYLRNARNKFYREHKVEMKEASQVSKKDLCGVVDRWAAGAGNREVELVHEQPFYNLIETGFNGLTTARAMIINDQVVGFNAGWEIPNSKNFYAGIGIHDYSVPDLGLMLYLEDLEWMKKAGYPMADMGGIEEGNPLKFKNQFQPESWYNTYVFTIVRK